MYNRNRGATQSPIPDPEVPAALRMLCCVCSSDRAVNTAQFPSLNLFDPTKMLLIHLPLSDALSARSFTPPSTKNGPELFFSLPNFAAAATAEKLIAPELTLAFVLPFPFLRSSNFLADERTETDGRTRKKGRLALAPNRDKTRPEYPLLLDQIRLVVQHKGHLRVLTLGVVKIC